MDSTGLLVPACARMIFDAPKSLVREASKAIISAIYKQKSNLR